MTIYRLNRVPDKLHVALLELLGIRLDGPSAARHRACASGSPTPPTEPIADPRRRRPRSARRARPTEESVVFQVDEDFTIPRDRARPPTCVQRGGQVKDVGVADGDGAARRAPTSSPFGTPAAGRRRALPRLRGAARAAADAGRRRRARRPAAPASNPEDPPLRWEVSQGDGEWARGRACSRTSPAASTTAPAPSSSSCRRARRSQPLGGQRLHWLRCRIDDTTRAGGAGATYTHPPEIYSITAAPIGALLPADARRAASRARSSACPTARPARSSRCATARCSSRRRARRSRSRTRSPATGRAGSCARTSSARPSSTATSTLDLGQRRGRARPGDPRDRRRLDAVRRGPAQGRGAALHPLPPRRRPRRQRRRRHADRAARARSPGVDTVTNPDAGDRRRRRRDARRTRASARRWRSARATARSPPRTSSSSPARRRPRVARAVCIPPRDGGAGAAAPRPARLPGRPPARATTSSMPDEELLQRGRRVPRRAAADRHDGRAAAVPLPRAVASS